MQEYNDGSFGEIQDSESLLKSLVQDEGEMSKTKAIYFGTEDELKAIKNKTLGAFGGFDKPTEDATSVKSYLRKVDEKLDMIIKHFKIYPIIGE